MIRGVAGSLGVSSSDSSSDDDSSWTESSLGSSLDSISLTDSGSSSTDMHRCSAAKTLLGASENSAQSVIGCTRGRNANEVLRV